MGNFLSFYIDLSCTQKNEKRIWENFRLSIVKAQSFPYKTVFKKRFVVIDNELSQIK